MVMFKFDISQLGTHHEIETENEYDQNKNIFCVGVFIYMTHSRVYMMYDLNPVESEAQQFYPMEFVLMSFYLLLIIKTRSWNEKVISLERTR